MCALQMKTLSLSLRGVEARVLEDRKRIAEARCGNEDEDFRLGVPQGKLKTDETGCRACPRARGVDYDIQVEVAVVRRDAGHLGTLCGYGLHLGACQDLGRSVAGVAHEGVGEHGGVEEAVVRAPPRTEDAVEHEVGNHVVDLRVIVPVLGSVTGRNGEIDGLLHVHLVVLVRRDRQSASLLKARRSRLVGLEASVKLESEQPNGPELVGDRVIDQTECSG